MKILFIQTGGTIDKDYPKTSGGYAFEISEPAVERIMKRAKPDFEYEIISVCRKDSIDLTADDRLKLLEICSASQYEKIIITHGTDTIKETARFLSDIKDKTIVLTGAFRPEHFKDSDADFNMGTAVGALTLLKNGVYIVLTGTISTF